MVQTRQQGECETVGRAFSKKTREGELQLPEVLTPRTPVGLERSALRPARYKLSQIA